jgi:[CysO sulfur-carrier protein]-S-L-cysteine hydrolase
VADELHLSRAIADEMVEHCVAGRPNEACGILASKDGEMVKVFKMTNASASPMRYSLDPKEQFAVYRKLDDEGWELGGVFHSHTRTEAYPSPTDVRLASEDVPYLIVSLAEKPASIRAFRILKDNWTDESGDVVEIPVVLAG